MIRFYWCVNCGYFGDFRSYRKRGLKCQKCGYEELLSYSEEDWIEELRERPNIVENLYSRFNPFKERLNEENTND